MGRKKKVNMDATFIQLNKFVETPEIIADDYIEIVKYGVDNKLPYLLTDYYKNVGLNRAIIDKKKKMFLGKGIAIDIVEENELKIKKTMEFLSDINEFENIDELFDKISLDIMLYGGTYLQIIWETGGKKIKYVYHMDYNKMRSGKKDKYGQVRKFYYNTNEDKSFNWSRYSSKNDPGIIEMNAFSTKLNKSKQQIMYIKEYEPGLNYYSLPDYIGALKDLDTSSAISDFYNSNMHNNMQPGVTFFFTGPEPDKDTKDTIIKAIKKKYTDTENAGKPMIFWLEDGQEMKMEIPESGDIGDMFKLLNEDIKENITISHQIPRAVAALSTPGSLGNSKDIIDGIEMVRSNYIEPKQEWFLSKFNKIMEINDLYDIKLNAPSPNLSKYSISDLAGILTTNEIREYLGKEPVGDEEKQEVVEEEVKKDNILKKIFRKKQ